MSKRKLDDDDFMPEDDDNIESFDTPIEDTIDEDPIEDSVIISEDDDNIDIIIEVSDESIIDKPIDDESIADPESDDIVLSKHKLQGKHSLKYDSIFKGKKDEMIDDADPTTSFFNEKFEVDKGSIFYTESYENESYLRQKRIKEKVYEVLSNKTTINFLNNRRKPSRVDFNNYYLLLSNELVSERFTNVELFNELSVYFSDNLFNMFKLLDNKWRNLIIIELQDHIGRNTNSKEITNRNIHLGTEVEFEHLDIIGDLKLFTGVVIETNYETSHFKIDSYENIYDVHISFITKILNNTKFKHNLNKLDNIDFL
jgi:hypothetical protein